MKINLETRNIFTRRGRLNRRIDKHKKLLEKIGDMDEVLAILNGGKHEYQSSNDSTIIDECIIRCDGCGFEFNIFDEDVETASVSQTENEQLFVESSYICPKCGYHNEIELDELTDEEEDLVEEARLGNEMDIIREEDIDNSNNLSNSEDSKKEEEINNDEDTKTTSDDTLDKIIDIVVNDENAINKYDEFYDDESSTKEKIITKRSKEVNINNKNNKSHKVVINKSTQIQFIHDQKILNAINIAIEHKPTSETICSLADNNISMKIDMATATDKHMIGYTTDNGEISFACSRESKEYISIFTINTKLAYMPHGNHNNIYNSIMSQLNIEKVSNKCEQIGLPGKAYIIKLHDDSIAACNFMINNNNIIITIIYDIDKD